MKIIVAGVGEVGKHLIKLLSNDGHDISVIDVDPNKINYIQGHFDVSCFLGRSSCPNVLRSANVNDCDIVISCSDSDENNLLTSMISKKLGAKKTISRLKSNDYTDIDIDIDDMIITGELAASEVKRLLNGDITDSFEFNNGDVKIIGININENNPLVDKRTDAIDDTKLIAVLRDDKTIIASDRTTLRKNDQAYLITKKCVHDIEKACGQKHFDCRSFIINGINDITENLLRELDGNTIKVFDTDKEKCAKLSSEFSNCLVINSKIDHDMMNQENITDYDCFISVSDVTEENIITSLMAKKQGVKRTIALVDNTDLIHLSQKIGIDTLINKKILAADAIYKHIRGKNIISQNTLHGVDAEILEFTVTAQSKLAHKTIINSKLPGKVICMKRGDETILPDQDNLIQIGDNIIIISEMKNIKKIESFF